MPANPSQANDANRADQDSPFALLMAASAPKEDKPAREQNDVEKPANDQPGVQPARPQSRTESKPKAQANEKAKPDEKATAQNDDQGKKEEVAVSNDNAAPATPAQSVAANPVPPPQPVVPPIVIADAAEQPATADASTPQGVAPATAATPAAAPTQDLAVVPAAQAATSKDAAPQTKPAAATPATAETQPASQPQMQQAAAKAGEPQAPVSGTPQDAVITDPQPAAPQTTAQQATTQQAAVQQTAAPQVDAARNAATAPAKETLVQVAALQHAASTKPAEDGEQSDAPASTDTSVKTDTAKPVTHDIPAQGTESKDVKADAPRPEIAKTDSAKPDMAQQAPVETAAPKSAPQPQTPANTNIASVHTNVATQPGTATPVLPGMPQHVQVSTPQPNMPALAVEIAAKSQSGAKQFDIRLDPPELGRVEIRLSIDAAGKASAHLSADQPQTLDLLQKDAASLTRALREAGLNVSQDGLNFSLRQQSHDGNGAQQGQARHASPSMTLIATNSIEATQTSAAYRGDGRLDIRV